MIILGRFVMKWNNNLNTIDVFDVTWIIEISYFLLKVFCLESYDDDGIDIRYRRQKYDISLEILKKKCLPDIDPNSLE